MENEKVRRIIESDAMKHYFRAVFFNHQMNRQKDMPCYLYMKEKYESELEVSRWLFELSYSFKKSAD